MAPANASSGRSGRIRNREAIARKRTGRGMVATNRAGSTKPPWWLATRRTGPVRGMRSSPVTSTARNQPNVAALAISRTSRSATPRIAAWSHLYDIRVSRGDRLGAWCGLLGPAAFTVAWLVAQRRQDEYEVRHEHISGLAAKDANDPLVMT